MTTPDLHVRLLRAGGFEDAARLIESLGDVEQPAPAEAAEAADPATTAELQPQPPTPQAQREAEGRALLDQLNATAGTKWSSTAA